MLHLNKILSTQNRNLLREMVRTDFKLRYQGSVLGYLWSLLRPLMLSGTLYLVFSQILRIGDTVPHYGSYLLLGIMCWTFFTEVTTGSITAVVAKGDLIRKIAIPRYLTVVSASFSAVINFLLNFFVLGVIMAITGVDIQIHLLILIPLLIIELYILALSIAFFLSALYVKYRDIAFIWEVLTQMMFYLIPILYPLSLLTDRTEWAEFLMLNPVAQIFQDVRYILITDTQPTTWSLFGIHTLWVFVMLFVIAIYSWYFFKKESKLFAENV